MPLFLDLHDLPDGVTAAHVAEMHKADLDIEHEYGCRGLTYWCDEIRKTAFCLIEAPSKEALIELHENAHGAVPTRIIEVNDTIVESFLGRIEDPEKSKDDSLNIINDPAFRTLMILKIKNKSLRTKDITTLQAAIRGYTTAIKTLIAKYNGGLVRHETNLFLVSFASVSDSIHCATEIIQSHNIIVTPDLEFKIGMSAGIPVTNKDEIFEDTIRTSDCLSDISKGNFSITKAVNDLYESENQNKPIHSDSIVVVKSKDEEFLMSLMNITAKIWSHSITTVNDFEENLGYSKSKFYRTMMDLVGKSPNTYLRDYRLDKALALLRKQDTNISEIAYSTGFNSPAYFSKCFFKKYGIQPSSYIF